MSFTAPSSKPPWLKFSGQGDTGREISGGEILDEAQAVRGNWSRDRDGDVVRILRDQCWVHRYDAARDTNTVENNVCFGFDFRYRRTWQH